MKKIITSLLVASSLALTANAQNVDGSKFANIHLGINGDEWMSGADFMTPEDTGHRPSFGLSIEYIGFQGSTNPTQSYGSLYNLDAELKMGWNIQALTGLPFPLRIKAGVGYGVTRVNTSNHGGVTYSTAAETTIYKKFGIGVEYKKIKTNTFINDLDSTNAYISMNF